MDAPETLLFDLGNVLFPFDWGRAVRAFSKALDRPEETVRKQFGRPGYAALFNEFGTGQISRERFYRRMNLLLDSDLEPDLIARIWCSIFSEDVRMGALLRNLKSRYRTYILSDTDPLHWEWLDRNYGVEEWTHGSILSFRQGRMKADPGAFAEIVESYRLTPERTLFVDDLEKNITAAEKAGLRGIVHRGFDETVEGLKVCGVTV